MRFNFSLTSFVFLKTSVSWGFSCFCCRRAACMRECFLQDLQKDRNIQYLLYRPSYPTKVSLTRIFWMLRAKASLISKSLCPVGSWQLLLAYLWLSVAASLRNSIVEQLICVWIGWCTRSPQLHPKVLCFITSVLIPGPSTAATGRFSPSQFSCWLPAMLGAKRGSTLGTSSSNSLLCWSDWGGTGGEHELSICRQFVSLPLQCFLEGRCWVSAQTMSSLLLCACFSRQSGALQEHAATPDGQRAIRGLLLSFSREPWGLQASSQWWPWH